MVSRIQFGLAYFTSGTRELAAYAAMAEAHHFFSIDVRLAIVLPLVSHSAGESVNL